MGQSEAIIYQKPFVLPKNEKPFLMSEEMQELAKHFGKLEAGQEKIHGKFEMMESALVELKGAVMGNPPMGMKGLADRVQEIEEKVKAYDKIYYKAMGMALLIGVVWPIVVAILLKLLTNYMGK